MPVITCPDCGKDVSTLSHRVSTLQGVPPLSGLHRSPGPYGGARRPCRRKETLWRGSPSWRVLIGKVALMILTVIVVPFAASFIASHTATWT